MNVDRNDLRKEYRLSDFPGGFVRGKYAKRIRASSNVVVLKPEVAEAFPNEEAVNEALLSLLEIARKVTKPGTSRSAKVKSAHSA
jgi:hypothetical protein